VSDKQLMHNQDMKNLRIEREFVMNENLNIRQVSNFIIEKIIESQEKLILENNNELVTFLNPFSYFKARNDPIFCHFNTIFVDGFLLASFINISGIGKVYTRSFDMSSIAPVVFLKAIELKKKLYFIGGDYKKIDAAIDHIKMKYEKLEIIGYRHGYFKNKFEYKNIISEICAIAPDIVVCGMGTPLQEVFLVDLKETGWKGVGFTCGAFLNQISENIYYYPIWSKSLNLRWFYRLIREPRKIIHRLTKEYILFFVFFIIDLLYYKKMKR